jgi:hypothetical protein
MSSNTTNVAKLLEYFARGVAAHDRETDHRAWGIGLHPFDLDRLGLEEGEEILPGIVLQADRGVTGNFRILCDGQHDEDAVIEEEEAIDAVATEAVPVPRVTPPV